jgi:hypothetical protein
LELFAVHRRLENVEFIKSQADEVFHNELMNRVRSMGGTPVESTHPYAWKINYERWENLIRENGDGRQGRVFKPYVDPVAEYVRDWKEYHSQRDSPRYMAERQGLTEADVAPFLKLEIGDLTTRWPQPDLSAATLPRDWDKAACRVSDAYREHRSKTDEQFTNSYLCFVVKQMQIQLAALAAKTGD